jgi:hypothetical protein
MSQARDFLNMSLTLLSVTLMAGDSDLLYFGKTINPHWVM